MCTVAGAIVGGFNPRSREGNDTIEVTMIDLAKTVSIHVPARGTTLMVVKSIRI